MTRTPSFKVFILNDSALVRGKLLRLLDDIPGAEFCGDAEDALTAIHALSISQPDLLLLDITLPGNTGYEILDYASRHLRRCKIIVLSDTACAWRRECDDMRPGSDSTDFVEKYIHPGAIAEIRDSIKRAFSDAEQKQAECRIICPDGAARYVYDRVDFISLSAPGSHASGEKITERRHAEIERSKVNLQTFLEQLPGVPYLISLEKQTGSHYISPKIEQLLGFTSEQWCADPQLRMRQLHPEDRPNVLRAIGDALAANQAFEMEYRIFTRSGEVKWFHDQARVIADANGSPLFLQGVVLDITEQKHAQAELAHSHRELQKVISAVDSLRAEEQKRLASELHDDLGQLLAAMKIDLTMLQQRLPQGDFKLSQDFGGLNELLDSMVVSLRRIIADLPPEILDDLGLFKALQSMVANFQARHHIECHLNLPTYPLMLGPHIATPVYRIVQEALNNVAKHARASRIDILFGCQSEHLALCITDNGKGMAADQMQKSGSFGLIGMRDRVNALGGKMKLESRPGAGTAIQIFIPIPVCTHLL